MSNFFLARVARLARPIFPEARSVPPAKRHPKWRSFARGLMAAHFYLYIGYLTCPENPYGIFFKSVMNVED